MLAYDGTCKYGLAYAAHAEAQKSNWSGHDQPRPGGSTQDTSDDQTGHQITVKPNTQTYMAGVISITRVNIFAPIATSWGHSSPSQVQPCSQRDKGQTHV